MVDLSIKDTSYGGANRRFLIGKRGVDTAIGVSLDVAAFDEGDSRWPDDELPPGLILAQNGLQTNTDQIYGPWSPNDYTGGATDFNTDPYAAACCVLLNPVKLNRASGAPNPSAAAMIEGNLDFDALRKIQPDQIDSAPFPVWAGMVLTQIAFPSVYGWMGWVGMANFWIAKNSRA